MLSDRLGFLEGSLTPEVQRIMLIDGPVVLGPEERRENDERDGLSTMRGLLKRAVAEGSVAPIPLEAMSHMLLAASHEAARFVANSAHPRAAKDQAISAMNQLLDGLQPR